ncbi:MAG: HEAT repeat domain-containing protein [Elusimicrobia bacterium]|nr:HEAT repeat domain-containing protein [Elusimicrobiota bacterium]MDE2511568.1 HEAT repeat domain-containing protein [Elusimicrobiota bacterium]
MPTLSAFYLACALVAGAGGAAAQGVDVSSTTRLDGVMASIRARDPKAGADLAARFDAEPAAGIRAWIVRGEAALKAPQGPALFKKALADASPLVRAAAAEALAQSQGAVAVPDLAAALAAEANAGVRLTITFWLGTMKTPASSSALGRALVGDADANVRVQAARSLKQHGTREARRALKAAKGDQDERVRGVVNEP